MITKGIAGRRNGKVKGVVIHNDAGSNAANVSFYKRYVTNSNAANGFAHYYIASDGMVQMEDEANMAWHTANSDGNANYIGIEACQSMGDKNQFLANEAKAIKLAAEILKRHGLQPNKSTVRLHNSFSATACPHRSQEIHGPGAKTQDYFISEIKKYMGGSTPTGKPHPSPAGNIDKFEKQGDKIICDGWVYVPQISGYNYAILLDEKGREIDRKKSKGIVRKDVNKALNVSEKYAFGLHAEFKYSQVKGKKVKVVFRRTQDEKGNVKQPTHDIFSGLKKF
ncbi:N-acetylmuramoyl-L-alanine amidase [Enterococcus hirae]|nr:N-acetylmuramoyl-L-alanine amidase [Enterococcus hirae]